MGPSVVTRPWEGSLTDRIDRKLREVPVAEFRYRHEAEFAAGFLREAGIPYRLQMDDAGGVEFGLAGTRPAVIWVLGMDVERARELIHADDPPEESARGGVPVARRSHDLVRRSRMTLRERLLAGVLAAVLVVSSLAFVSAPLWSLLMALAALGFTVVAAIGRAPGLLGSLLRTLSGEAP